MKYIYKLIIVLFLIAGISACSDFLDPSSPQNKPISTIDDINGLKGLITAAHDRLSEGALYGQEYIVAAAVRSDNAYSNGNTNKYPNQSKFSLTINSQAAVDIWANAYDVIANCNLVIHSDVGTSPEVKYLKGQAYALRALAHMMILQIYGQQYVDGSNLGIPYITTFGKEENFNPSRLTVQETYEMIGADYQKAVELMDPALDGNWATMTYYGARALQARYALFVEDYALASEAAMDVISSGKYSLVPASKLVQQWAVDGAPSFVFGINYTGAESTLSIAHLYLEKSSTGDIEATPELYNIYGSNDVRLDLLSVFQNKNPVNYRMSGKFTVLTGNGDRPIIRYAEVLLIYAEAQARLGNSTEALKYLNKIPKHRNAIPYDTASIENILLERRKELAMEGRRFFTLMRTERDVVRTLPGAAAVYSVEIPYGDYRLAYPISNDELNANPNIEQNEGYTDL